MGKKSHWLRILTETIGVPQIIAIVVGVPAMIYFILTIWHALKINEQIIVVSTGSLMILAIVLFTYGQIRKVLYVIPDLLYKIHSVYEGYAKKLNLTMVGEEKIKNTLKLLGIDLDFFASSIKSESEIPIAFERLYLEMKDKIKDEDAERVINYLKEKSGLQALLIKDKTYIKLVQKLKKMRLLVPTEDIITSVNEFTKTSNKISVALIMIQAPSDILSKAFSPRVEADYLALHDLFENDITTSLVKVRESIEKYYKVGIK